MKCVECGKEAVGLIPKRKSYAGVCLKHYNKWYEEAKRQDLK